MTPRHNPDSTGRGLLLLSLLLLAVLTAAAILTRPLIPIDETRYVSAAWEMWLRGDFLVPFKNGAPYSDKPPFLFWMFQAGWALFGVNDWWPRLVLPLFSAGGLLLTFGPARRLWPQRAGLGGQAALVLASASLWIVFSTSVMFDVMLAFWVLIGLHGVLAATDGKRGGFAVLGVAVGLGVLTKGPVILLNLLPVVALAPWWNPGLKWGRWFGGTLLAVLLVRPLRWHGRSRPGFPGARRIATRFSGARPPTAWSSPSRIGGRSGGMCPCCPCCCSPGSSGRDSGGRWRITGGSGWTAARAFASPGCCRYSSRFASSAASSRIIWYRCFRRLRCWLRAYWPTARLSAWACLSC